jgi:hypothetical protein
MTGGSSASRGRPAGSGNGCFRLSGCLLDRSGRLPGQDESIPLTRACQVTGPTMPSTVTDEMS